MEEINVIHVRGGKTGKEVHLATGYEGRYGSSTDCGEWLKYSVLNFKTDVPVTCKKCLARMEKRGKKK